MARLVWLNGANQATDDSLRGVADVNATVTSDEMGVAFTSLTAARTVTLPAASAAKGWYLVKDESGSCDGTKTITVSASSGNIDGAANKVLNSAYAVLRVYSNGTNYFTF